MKYTKGSGNENNDDELLGTLEPVAKGLGLAILELTTFRRKARGKTPGSVQVRITVYKDGNIGVDDCSAFHRAILPRLELVFGGLDLYLEVSSPGIGRLIKDGSEMVHFIGRGIRCYRSGRAEESGTDHSGWIAGVLKAADENGITLETGDEIIVLPYEAIAKAKLDTGG